MAERTRRRFLAEGAMALAGVAVAGTVPAAEAAGADAGTPTGSGSIFSATPGAGSMPPGPPVTAATFAEAEKLMRVTLTPAQRAQAAESWDGNLGAFFGRRSFHLSDADVPATVWNPGLQGTGRMPKRNRVVRSPAISSRPPKGDDDLAFAPVHQLSRWLQAREVSSVRLTELALARLERFQHQLNCTITLVRKQALQQAEVADREIAQGHYRGPLHGIPYGAKDLLDTAGIRTTWGAEPFRDRVPAQDATVIARLRAAGAILVAKLALGGLALNDVWFGGRTNNPWLLEEGSGGSSAGSAAAVGAGCVPFAIGSETYGSIVDPCDRCGTTGLRPTFGRVPRGGAMALSWSHDKLGPIARSVEDVALVLAAISGPDPGDLSSQPSRFAFDATRPVKGLKVGIVPAWMAEAPATEADRAALEALRKLGLEVVELSFPPLPWACMQSLVLADAAASFEELTLSGKDGQLRMQTVDSWPNLFRQSRFISAVDYVQADRVRRRAAQAWNDQLANVDLMLGPSWRDELLSTNSTGHPCLVMRAGFGEIDRVRSDWLPPRGQRHPALSPKRRVPHSTSLVGQLWDEGTVCSVGVALERALGVADARPPGFA
jgi:Asp-tRNA(Asn)/Glu-tRNA(Gln) amidotransferase A subunit family amidase